MRNDLFLLLMATFAGSASTVHAGQNRCGKVKTIYTESDNGGLKWSASVRMDDRVYPVPLQGEALELAKLAFAQEAKLCVTYNTY